MTSTIIVVLHNKGEIITMSSSPVSVSERVSELDILRGFALLGVFMGMAGEYIFFGWATTWDQVMSMPTAEIDATYTSFVHLFVTQKANTLFAFMFGLSFTLMMHRLEAKRSDFERIYLRRLVFLTLFGFIHMFFIQPLEILHLYGLLGFVLFALRKMKTRHLLYLGLPLALFGMMIANLLIGLLDLRELFNSDYYFSDEAIHLRQTLSENADYWGYVQHSAGFTTFDWFLSGAFLSWCVYGLGRFLLGAYVGRKGWLFEPARYLKWYRILLLPTLLVGLGLGAITAHPSFDWQNYGWLGGLLRTFSVPITAMGYACLIVVGANTPYIQHLFRQFAPVGQMALTNYVAAGLITSFTFFGYFGGADLAGEIGMRQLVHTVLLSYLGMMIFSRIWLHFFAFGPLEWIWRCLTYGQLFNIARKK